LDNPFTAGQWQQSWFQHPMGFAPSRWSFIEFDVKVDAANSTADGNGNYGGMQLDIRKPNWSGDTFVSCPNLTAAYTSWQHVKVSLPVQDQGPAFDIILNGVHGGAVRVLIDNIKLTTPITPPKILALGPGTRGGVHVFVDGNGNNNIYDEEGFASPAADNGTVGSSPRDFFWLNQTPASYSFTLDQFPAPSVAPSFRAHMYIFNGDSLALNGQSFSYNTTYSGARWNALDYLGFLVENGTNGGVVATLDWKTNAPNSNPTNSYVFNLPQYATANGTWTVNFSDSTHAAIIAPDGATVGNVTLPDFQSDPNYTSNFQPGTSCIQFGLSKNGNTNNNDKGAYFTHVVVTNGPSGTIYDDTFQGPGLTGLYAWQVATYYQYFATRAIWQPYGTAFWLQYGEPSFGYTVRSAPTVLGPWSDAGVTYTYTDATGTNHFAAIPTASLPPGNKGFFRLGK
jgi:hypothetical protein